MRHLVKSIIRKIVYGHASDSDTFICYLRKQGCSIGNRVTIYDPPSTTIDMTRPWLISIGNDVKITRGVTILTHGYDWSVLQGVYGEILGSSGRVIIDNNVFIGMHATILKGVHIGSNVIIGAGSLVNKDVPDNVVIAGVPAKVIMPLDEYYKKRKAVQVEEATELIQLYIDRFGEEPNDYDLHEFFWLFEDNPDSLPECWKKMMQLHGNEEKCNTNLRLHQKSFENKKELLAYAKSNK